MPRHDLRYEHAAGLQHTMGFSQCGNAIATVDEVVERAEHHDRIDRVVVRRELERIAHSAVKGASAWAAAYVEHAARRGDYAFEDFSGAKANQITDARTP